MNSRFNDSIYPEPFNINRCVPEPKRTLRAVKRQVIIPNRNRQESISDDAGLERTLEVRLEASLFVESRKSGALRDGDEGGRVSSRPSEMEHGLVIIIGDDQSPFLPSVATSDLGTEGREIGGVGGRCGGRFSRAIVDVGGRNDCGRNGEG